MNQNYFRIAISILVISVALTVVASAQTFKTVVEFDGANGGNPIGSLIQGTDGNFYGVTQYGGNLQCGVNIGCGTIYKISPQGVFTTVYKFCSHVNCADGISPVAGLLLGTDGNFYGTTSGGGNGISGMGTVFKITPGGTLTTLYTFCLQANCPDGANPAGSLLQAADGNFYGTTEHGSNEDWGTVFRITPSGALTTIFSFWPLSGTFPFAGLTYGPDGKFYGTTSQGGIQGTSCENSGDNGCGLAFSLTPTTYATLYEFCQDDDFCVPDGAIPSGLTLGVDGNFYGTTYMGGTLQTGTLFQLTSKGRLTTLHSFCAQRECSDGANPGAPPLQGTDGAFYGTTADGGNASCGSDSGGCGIVYRFTADGAFTVIHTFENTDGEYPEAPVAQATEGYFIGTTYSGDKSGCFNGCGTVFGISTGLGPFVAFVQNFGKVGQTGQILGQGFTGTTSVELNGKATSFTVVSDTFIRFTVPKGANSGYVTVTTPGHMLKSNVRFVVLQ